MGADGFLIAPGPEHAQVVLKSKVRLCAGALTVARPAHALGDTSCAAYQSIVFNPHISYCPGTEGPAAI
jgi:hypothetical protein